MDANTPILSGPTFVQDPTDLPPPSPLLVEHLREVFKWVPPVRGLGPSGMDAAINVAMQVSQQSGRDEVIQYLFNLINKED